MADIAMIVFGLMAAAYTTIQTVRVRVSFPVSSPFSSTSFIVNGWTRRGWSSQVRELRSSELKIFLWRRSFDNPSI